MYDKLKMEQHQQQSIKKVAKKRGISIIVADRGWIKLEKAIEKTRKKKGEEIL